MKVVCGEKHTNQGKPPKKETIELNERIYNCTYNFEPKIGQTYHIYRNTKGEEFLSIILPSEWNMEHVISVRLNSDSVWKKIP
jgi:hypothetical protein